MSDLDFSALSDDQLMELIQASIREACARGQTVAAAAADIYLDAKEQVRIAEEGAAREAAKLRAQERQRIAEDSAEQVRRDHAAAESATAAKSRKDTEARHAREAREAAAAVRERHAQRYEILRAMAGLIGREPTDITLLILDLGQGKRVLVNAGGDSRYAREHLIEYSLAGKRLRTVRALIGHKPQILDQVAALAAAWKKLILLGEDDGRPL